MKNVRFKEDEEDLHEEYIFIEDRTTAIHTEIIYQKVMEKK